MYFISQLTLISVSLFTFVAWKLTTIFSSFQVPGNLYSSFPSLGSIPNGPVWPPILPGGLCNSHGRRLVTLFTLTKERLFPGKISKFWAFLWLLLLPHDYCIVIPTICLYVYSLFRILKYLQFKREIYKYIYIVIIKKKVYN